MRPETDTDCQSEDCFKLENNAGFNVKLHFYDAGEKIYESEILEGGGTAWTTEPNELTDADKIEAEARVRNLWRHARGLPMPVVERITCPD
jgi:hypothetical protein